MHTVCHPRPTNMPRGTPLSIFEQKEASRMHGEGKLQREIACALNRSTSVVGNYLRDPHHYNTTRRSGRKKKLTTAQNRSIARTLSRKRMSSSQLVAHLNLPVCRQTVWRSIRETTHFRHCRMNKTLDLQEHHKEKRLSFAIEHAAWNQEWSTVLFSDEKKFNLDGPDGYKFYWHDLRQERRTYFSRHSGGKSVMVWGAISASGKSALAVLDGTLNAVKYVDILENYLLPFAYCVHGESFTFMQDNAAVHTARYVQDWFEHTKIDLLQWPAKSPDLNPIENIWGALSRMVYAQGRQYNTVEALKQAIIEGWDNISAQCVQRHIASMPNRCIQMIKSDGNKIAY